MRVSTLEHKVNLQLSSYRGILFYMVAVCLRRMKPNEPQDDETARPMRWGQQRALACAPICAEVVPKRPLGRRRLYVIAIWPKPGS